MYQAMGVSFQWHITQYQSGLCFNEKRFFWFPVLVQGQGDVSGAGPSVCRSGSSTGHLLAADRKHASVDMSSPPLPGNSFGSST